MQNTWEIFHSAALELAGSGPIKRRLFGAYVNHLSMLIEDELPNEIREDFSSLVASMQCVRPLPGEDAVRATVRKMSDGDANRHAMQIVHMMGTVARSQMNGRAATPASVVQLYAAEA
jgi:hypothetical protein